MLYTFAHYHECDRQKYKDHVQNTLINYSFLHFNFEMFKFKNSELLGNCSLY